MSNATNQSPVVLKKKLATAVGAALLGTANGKTVEQRFTDSETMLANFAGQRQIPHSQFNWLGVLPTVNGVGNVHASESVSAYVERVHAGLIGSGEIWVDVNGDDSDPEAGAFAKPIETIERACRVLSASRVFLIGSDDVNNPVLFDKFQFRGGDPTGHKIKIIEALGHCKIIEKSALVDAFDSVTWTPIVGMDKVFEFTKSSGKGDITKNIDVRAVLFESIREADGRAMRIPKRGSIASVNSTGVGWFDDGEKVYLRIQSQNIESIKSSVRAVYANQGTSRALIYGAKMLLKAGKGSSMVFEGVNLQPLYLAPNRAELYVHGNVKVQYSQDHGLDALGAITYTQDMEIYASKSDNFHYTDATLSCKAVEIDCKSTFAGDVATYGALAAGTDNGSAMHGTGDIVTFGGECSGNNGPDIVHSGTGKYWMVGVKANFSGNRSNGAEFHVTGGEMFLDTCHASDGEYDLRIDAGAVMNVYNTIYRTVYNLGTLNSYNPTLL